MGSITATWGGLVREEWYAPGMGGVKLRGKEKRAEERKVGEGGGKE